jgi:hypothetical protein
VEKLLHSQMPYGYTTRMKRWYTTAEDAESKTILENGIECPSLDDCLKRIISTQDFALCGGGVHLLYLSYKEIYSYSGRPKFIPFKDDGLSFLTTMFFRSGSPLWESFNRIIYRLVESGIVQKFWDDIKQQHIGQKEKGVHKDGDKDAQDGGPDVVVLTLDHLEGAFIFLLLGLACSLTVFIIELLCFTSRKYLLYHLINRSV